LLFVIAQRFHKENYQVVILDCDKETLQILAVDGGFDAAGVGLPSLRT
jgi:hypothetical protein